MPKPDFHSANILVIDDEPAVVEMIAHLFRDRRLGTVRGTTDPREAVALFREVQPDLVLLDLMMPQMNGLQVLQALRGCEHHAAGRVPILVITSDSTVASRHAALGQGATDFLNKPFDSVEIVLRATNLLETRFLHRQLAAQNEFLGEQLRERQRAEDAMQSAAIENARFAAAIASSGTAVCITDPHRPDNPIVFTNAAFTAITGYPADEVIGRNCRFLQGAETDRAKVQRMRDATTERKPFRGTVLNYRKDGTPFWNELTISPVFNGGGELINFVGLQTDVSARIRAEEALRETGDRLQAILNHSPSAIFVKDRAGYFVEANPLLEAIFGRSRAEIVGKTDYDLPITRELADQLLEHDRRVFETGAPIHVEERVPGNGEMRTYLTVKFPLTDAQGRIYAVCGIGTDITEQRRDEEVLRASEERLRTTIDSALECIITMNAAGIVLEFNPAAEATFGYSRDEAVGRELAELIIPPAQRQQHRAGMAHYHATGTGPVLNRRIELPALRADGSEIQVELTVIRVGTGEPAIFTGFVRDITKRKLSEAALTAARNEAERANRAKSEFLSRMSHELRTPLNGILGFAQILEMNALEGQPGACVTHILKAGRHLLSLINEVLDLSGIEAGRVTYSIEPVRLLDVAREALDLVRPLAAPRRLRLDLGEETPADSWVLADRQRLQQVLLNLLANAVKYNREGGTVTLSWEEKPSERLRIMVRDTGQGIAPENLERLFVPFERLGAERTEVEGAGLGLSLSKKLIGAMGGEIGAESMVGAGSTFWIKLPRSSSPLARLHETGVALDSVAAVQRGTILYIEDNLANLALVEYLFAQRPQLKLLVAMQGRLGIELAREHQPDLILLDLHLPDIMGDEVLACLKGDAATRHIPVAMLTADATPVQEARLLAAGADHYFTKPIDVPQLLRLIEKTLEHADDK